MKPEELTVESVMALDYSTLRGKAYDAVQKWFADNYYERGVYPSGYRVGTGQVALHVMFDQNRKFEKQLGILDFLPYIKPIDGILEDRYGKVKLINILAHVGLFIVVTDQGQALLTNTSYEQEKFLNIEACLEYVYTNFPYVLKDDPYNDDEVVDRVLALLEKWDKDKEGKPEAEAAVFTSCIRDLTKALYPNRVEEE